MMFFGREATTADIRGHKRVRVNGMRFTIRRLNPLVDFTDGNMPQIFTAYYSRRPTVDAPQTIETMKKAQADMYAVIRAGLVEPLIVAEEAKDGLKASDLFRDPTMGPKLFIEIIAHSLQTFRGLKGLFFFHRIKLSLWTQWLKDMGVHRQKSHSPAVV